MTSNSRGARLTPLFFNIESRLDDPVDLASMAQQFGASPFHFHRLFRESTGETPRQHVERLRLERALLRLALTRESIREVCDAAGFRSHETFSRSFKRRFRVTPSQMRKSLEAKRDKHMKEAATAPPNTQCRLSKVRIESLKPTFLLAKRRRGEYTQFEYAPFVKTDRLWNSLARWATRQEIPYAKIGWGLMHDIPGVTPPDAQRFDGCIRIRRAVPTPRDIQCLRFAGGTYATIEHVGPPETLTAAYSMLVQVINLAPHRYAWRVAPSVTMYREVNIDGDLRSNRTVVCLPIKTLQDRKKRQSSVQRRR
jgi:AraC family transcriptional regulator